MPKVTLREDWKFKDVYAQRVQAALDWYALRQGQGYKDAGDLPEAKIRELLGLEAHNQWPRMAEFKRGERGVSVEMLKALEEKGGISHWYILYAQPSTCDKHEAALEILRGRWWDLCQEFARNLKGALTRTNHGSLWMLRASSLTTDLYSNLSGYVEMVPGTRETLDGFLDSVLQTSFGQALVERAKEKGVPKPLWAQALVPAPGEAVAAVPGIKTGKASGRTSRPKAAAKGKRVTKRARKG